MHAWLVFTDLSSINMGYAMINYADRCSLHSLSREWNGVNMNYSDHL